MAPPTTALARPPFAVDDEDTEYVEHTSRKPSRTREERLKVSESQYTAYDNYFDNDDPSKRPSSGKTALLAAPSSGHRPSPSADSAIDAIGDGFLAALGDSYDDSDDDKPAPSPVSLSKKPATPVADSPSAMPPKSKNQALFEAALADEKRSHSPLPPAYDDRDRAPPAEKGGRQLYPQGGPQQNRAPSPTPPPPAAPLQVHIPAHQMNAPQPKRPIQPGAGPQQGGLTIVPPPPAGMYGAPTPNGTFAMPPGSAPYASPGFQLGMGPTPIPANTSTPIQPAFIKPIKPAFLKSDSDENEKASIMSHDSTMPIMRSDKEDYLPLRSDRRRPPRVGEKVAGDEFWRRFSMVVKADRATPADKKQKSEWLSKHTRTYGSLSRWIWCAGLFALILIVGGSVAGWWFTRGSPAHQVPVAIGGGAEETMTGGGTTPDPTPVGASTAHATKTAAKAAKTTSAAAATTTAAAVDDDDGDDDTDADTDADTRKMKRGLSGASGVDEAIKKAIRRAAKSHRRRAPSAYVHLN